MRRRLRIAILLGGGLVLVGVAALGWLYWAARQVPEFYRAAMAADAAAQKRASDEMLQRSSALLSDSRKVGRWQALFTAEQINGWLAVDLAKNYPDSLPETFADPRVLIETEGITVACWFRRGGVKTVLNFTVQPHLPEPNVLALRIRRARAGRVPLPLREMLDHIAHTAAAADLPIRWQTSGGDPVAMISLGLRDDREKKVYKIDTLRLGEGEVYLAGTTSRQR